jgi:hypothetical protein
MRTTFPDPATFDDDVIAAVVPLFEKAHLTSDIDYKYAVRII